jgi:general secretion pathway protein K
MVNGLLNYLGKMLRRCKSERGMALLATMMAIALMTIIVVDFTSSSALGYLSAANNANEIRATYLARSAINVGLALIAQDTRAQMALSQTQQGASATTGQGQPFDSFASVWAIPFPPMPVNGGTVGLAVVDEARKFNINRLINAQPGIFTPGTSTPGGATSGTSQPAGTSTPAAPAANGANIVGQPNPTAIVQFTSLITMLGLDPTTIVPSVLDWLDPDSIEQQGGAESDYYMRLIPPYQPRNGPMPTIGDLRLVKGIDDATFAKLRNYLTVAPETAVNPNTASPEVLACLEPELTQNPDTVKAIINARSIRPFATVTDLTNEVPSAAAITKLSGDLTLRGQYFSIGGVGNYAGARKLVFATFRRNPDGTGTLSSWQED